MTGDAWGWGRTWVLAGAFALGGCSLLVDSDQYVGSAPEEDAGQTDGGVDGGVGAIDGGPGDDAAVDGGDPCAGVSCDGTEMCDPTTGECVPRCDPACQPDAVCVAGECVDCDGDDDGFFRSGVVCAPLRRMEAPDCDDGDEKTFPGAPIVCGDDRLNACPNEALTRLLEALEPVELARLPAFRVEEAFVDPERPWLSLVQSEIQRGTVAFMGTDGPALARYDLGERGGEVQRLEELVELRDGFAVEAVAVGFLGRPRLGVLGRVETAGWELSHHVLDDSTTSAERVNETVMETAVPPVAVGFGEGGAVMVRGTFDDGSSGTPPAGIVKVGETAVTALPNERVSLERGFLEARSSFVLASHRDGGGLYMIADEFDARAQDLDIPLAGTPDVVLTGDGPSWLAAFPTAEGIVGIAYRCGGGFPFDLAECEITPGDPFGPKELLDPVLALGRADELAYAALPTPGPDGADELTAFIVEVDANPVRGEAGMPLAFPLITQGDLGFEPRFLDVAAVDRFFTDAGVVVVYAAAVEGGTGTQLWLSALRQCAER